jgi:membrane protein involved in colicin uptake
MPNYHATSEGNIPFTAEEEAAWAAEQAAAAAAATAAEASAYKAQRAAEYPPVADYLDGIVKGDQAQVQAYVDACLAVKAKYPKPSAT